MAMWTVEPDVQAPEAGADAHGEKDVYSHVEIYTSLFDTSFDKLLRAFPERRVTLCCAKWMRIIRPPLSKVGHSFTFRVYTVDSVNHLVGQVGQWWGASPVYRFSPSDIVKWWSLSSAMRYSRLPICYFQQ
jgi:hypothetical protein